MEAMVYHDQHLYLFSKNMYSEPLDPKVKLYQIELNQEQHVANLIAHFDSKALHKYDTITGAALRDDAKVLVLLSHGHIHVFWDYTLPNFFSGKHKRIELWHFTQKETIDFIDPYTLIIADEYYRLLGPARMYTLSLKDFLRRKGL